MTNTPLPPIYRDCRHLLVHTEEVARRFSRYYKYTVGTNLPQQAMAIMRAVHVEAYNKLNQELHVFCNRPWRQLDGACASALVSLASPFDSILFKT